MKVTVDLCVIPYGAGLSLSGYVAECLRLIQDAGLQHHLHAYGTDIEGEWDDVMAVVKRCHEILHEKGVPRIATTLKIATRTDKEQSMDDKVRSVEEKLARG